MNLCQRVAGIDDILDNQHVTPGNRSFQILDDPHLTRRHHLVAVAGDGHEIDLDGQIEAAYQIGDKDEGAAQQTNDDKLFGVAILLRDHARQLCRSGRDLGLGNQDLDIMFGGQDGHALAPVTPTTICGGHMRGHA